MTTKISDVTQGLIEIAADLSHDAEEADPYDLNEYLALIPNSEKVLKELIYWVHSEYL